MQNITINTPGSHLMKTYQRAPIKLAKGKGSFVWDTDGEKYLDFTSGIATCNLGHVPDLVKNALMNQLDQIWHCSNLYQIDPQEKLAQLLSDVSCFDEVFFCNSGAEANEAAIKLARIYAKNIAHKQSTEIVTFTQSFHGRTLATLSATGQKKIQQGFEPLMPGFHYLPFNEDTSLKQLKQINPCAVLIEIVQGEGGVIPAKKEWIQELAVICKEQNILLMVDEIQTGMGRTGTLFAYEQYGIEPDIMTLAKGLGSGFPIGAMLAKRSIALAFTPGTHGSTFGGNPLAVVAGTATLEAFHTMNILEKCEQQIQELWLGLKGLMEKYPMIEEVRGRGFLIGVVINSDAAKAIEIARKEKLLLLSAGPNVIRILPPLTITNEEINLFLSSFTKVLIDMEGDAQ